MSTRITPHASVARTPGSVTRPHRRRRRGVAVVAGLVSTCAIAFGASAPVQAAPAAAGTQPVAQPVAGPVAQPVAQRSAANGDFTNPIAVASVIDGSRGITALTRSFDGTSATATAQRLVFGQKNDTQPGADKVDSYGSLEVDGTLTWSEADNSAPITWGGHLDRIIKRFPGSNQRSVWLSVTDAQKQYLAPYEQSQGVSIAYGRTDYFAPEDALDNARFGIFPHAQVFDYYKPKPTSTDRETGIKTYVFDADQIIANGVNGGVETGPFRKNTGDPFPNATTKATYRVDADQHIISADLVTDIVLLKPTRRHTDRVHIDFTYAPPPVPDTPPTSQTLNPLDTSYAFDGTNARAAFQPFPGALRRAAATKKTWSLADWQNRASATNDRWPTSHGRSFTAKKTKTGITFTYRDRFYRVTHGVATTVSKGKVTVRKPY